jgi:hypothetical protein
MKTDLYTKSILTIIAICLTINVVKELEIIPAAYANGNSKNIEATTEYKLVPIGEFETLDVRIVDINTYDELNVNIKSVDTYDEMRVNIKGIDTSDELDVNIDEIGGGWLSNGGPLPVKIQ